MKNQLLVIYYHEVVEKGQGSTYQKIEIEKFEAQMKYLYEQGYQTLFFSEVKEPLPKKALIVSFDDGFRTVFANAAPIMKKYNIKGNVYLPTAYIDVDPHFMTWDMVKALQKENQFEFQAHTHQHKDIRALEPHELLDEANTSNKIIMEQLGYCPVAFCMPYGAYDKKSVQQIRDMRKYDFLLGSFYGMLDIRKCGKRVLPRIGISNDDSIQKFADKLHGKYNWKGPLQKLRLSIQNIRNEKILEYRY